MTDSTKQNSACGSCTDSTCSASSARPNESLEEFEARQRLESRLCKIKHKIIVMSGKGGVGKSTVAVNLATALKLSGKSVGLLDVDIHGPSVPTMLGLQSQSVQQGPNGLIAPDADGIKVMSLGLLLKNEDDAVIWRGPAKMGAIKQFLSDVDWGELDYLVIDVPPGTGDEPLSICQLIGKLDGAVVVTTPQKVAAVDVRKSISFCKQLKLPVLGVFENMNGFICPKCGEMTAILQSGAGKEIANDMEVPFLGSLPIDPEIAMSCDNGTPFLRHFASSPTAEIMKNIIYPVIAKLEPETDKPTKQEAKQMKIAIPLAQGKLSMHFGHCEKFAVIDVDEKTKTITNRGELDAPPHEPGLLPRFLNEQDVTMIIAGGMGTRAQGLFSEQGINVVVGAPAESPETIVKAYLDGSLQTGSNMCDH